MYIFDFRFVMTQTNSYMPFGLPYRVKVELEISVFRGPWKDPAYVFNDQRKQVLRLQRSEKPSATSSQISVNLHMDQNHRCSRSRPEKQLFGSRSRESSWPASQCHGINLRSKAVLQSRERVRPLHSAVEGGELTLWLQGRDRIPESRPSAATSRRRNGLPA